MEKLEQRIAEIEKNIQEACETAGRDRSEVNVVAVTKSVSASRATDVLQAGFAHLGENRAEGLAAKQEDIKEDVIWHYIGNIQSRKVREIVDNVRYLHSLSRMSIVKEIQKRANETLDCFVQVNISGEDSKSGVSPEELQTFLNDIKNYDKVRIIGLMTMAPNTDDQKLIRSIFVKMRELRDLIASQNLEHAPCTELSMGMSNDYKIAIEEGATFVRIGTALVGTESRDD